MRAIAPLVLFLFPAAGAEAGEKRIEIVDFGLYSTRHVRTVDAPKQIAGKREIVSHIKLTRKTNRFIGQLGRTFGFRYRVLDRTLDGKRLTFRIIFPKPRLTNPKTGVTREFQDTQAIVRYGTVGFEGYGFDHRWEIAEGWWIMQIMHNGKVLAEQRFRVLVPLN